MTYEIDLDPKYFVKPFSPQERRFIEIILSDLEAGEAKPRSVRAAFRTIVEEGMSKRNARSLSHYGPGGRYSRIRQKIINEWKELHS